MLKIFRLHRRLEHGQEGRVGVGGHRFGDVDLARRGHHGLGVQAQVFVLGGRERAGHGAGHVLGGLKGTLEDVRVAGVSRMLGKMHLGIIRRFRSARPEINDRRQDD